MDILTSNYCELKSFFKIVLGTQTFSTQNSIIRVNCLDCLDRTNIIQNLIAWKIFTNMVKLNSVKICSNTHQKISILNFLNQNLIQCGQIMEIA